MSEVVRVKPDGEAVVEVTFNTPEGPKTTDDIVAASRLATDVASRREEQMMRARARGRG